ncbi:pyridoxal phosphate-dependent decarboxylase family protein [Pseudohalioglobus lutimaris]|uniref:Aspartate aminotransferase family protein n=1 Tax=Pseudohalioglobus lutimaris TaxID=1737061 RepID=A0A2N5X1U5_9GAMM|nr:aspartate aminotransferase family protein [Pseudohalioglobus lutimaris]PLW68461.1 aspartate aminotransferase family protein [Pseudohalioglobus lutimaris]
MHKAMPEQGRDSEQILSDLDAFKDQDPHYKDGRVWSLVYYLDEDHSDFLKQSYHSYACENGLNPGAFKSLKKIETEVISATADILNGTEEVCGVVTSGGTESCLMAVKTYRDMARDQRGVKNPEMIMPTTAHVAWFKASEYFGVKIRLVPLTRDFTPDLKKLKRLINRNTVMILGSAPEYPHGTIDPIEAMGAIAQKKKIPLHVDACVGGFILPFMAMNGEQIPPWDYRVPGVTSISADIHKYGYAAKGASTITYRNLDYLRYQMFAYENWPGGVFASSALLGTRPGGAYAAAWGVIQYFGKTGYRKLAEDTLSAVNQLKAGIAAMPELEVMGNPQGPLFSYRSVDADVNIYAVGDQMDARGWQVNRNQQPAGLHAMVTAQHLRVVDEYLEDLRSAVAAVKADPSLAQQGGAATYGMMAHVPLRGMVKKKVLEMYSEQYRAGGGELDLAAGAGNDSSLVDRLVTRYVNYKSRKAGS